MKFVYLRFHPTRQIFSSALSVVAAFNFYSCQKSFTSNSAASTATKAAEEGLCTTTYSGDGYTISGSAKYYYRARVVSGTTSFLSNPATTPNPIRLAEVHIYNSNGTLIDCRETSLTGTFTLNIPATSGDYVIKVLSRTKQSGYAVSVKEDIYSNALYALTKTVTVNSASISGVEIFAFARESESSKIEGGAFNILDQIVSASETIVGDSNLSSTDKECLNTKLNVYWKKGFNPYTYFGYSTPVSFYIPGDYELYILGGVNGNVSTSDTDHFDDSVISHEYGHFLEDVCARSDSPGGAHNGNFIIDPRLAWSEGWANYFQTITSKDSYSNYYIDTIGFSDSQEGGTPTDGITINFNDNARTATKDKVSSDGEGTYREVSISRSLYKMTKAASSSSDNVPFASIWKSFRDLSLSSEAFRNVGLFNTRLNSRVSSLSSGIQTHFSAVMSCAASPANNEGECQPVDSSYYAPRTTTSGSTCAVNITPVIDISSRSNLFRSNHFYQINHTGSSDTLSLYFTSSSPTQTTDLDLIVYKEDYTYIEDSPSIPQSTINENILLKSRTESYGSTTQAESVSLSGLPAGKYLINVKARTYNKSSSQIGSGANYQLMLGGSFLCPQTTW